MAAAVPLSQRRRRLLGRLRARKTREREGLVLVEGVRASLEALGAGVEVRFAVVSPRLDEVDAGGAVRRGLARHEVVSVSDAELAGLADTISPQGVLLVCPQPEVAPGGVGGRSFLVLDSVQDPGNAGTLVRSAAAFGLDGVLCLDGTVDPWGAKAVRASAGLVFRVPVLTVSVAEALGRLSELGVPLLVADAAGEPVSERAGAGGFALAVGNEGIGVRREVRRSARGVVAVPIRGAADSLNAAVAGSILMHTLSRGGTRG